jgi:hypothetical protein
MRFITIIFLLLAGCAYKSSESCITKLRQLDRGKEYWALEQGKTTNDTPTWEDLRPFFKSSPFICPNGGTYTIGRVGEMPTCSITNDTEKLRKVYSQ